MAVNRNIGCCPLSFSHMDNEEKIQKFEPWLASFRVICVGKEMSGVFRSIISLGLERVSVQTTTQFPDPTPTDENQMVILLSNGNSPQLESIAKSFYQAGVLTVLITTKIVEMTEVFCDSQTVVPIESMPFIVKTLLNYLLIDRQLTCFDFNDLCLILHKSSNFKVIEVSSGLQDNRIRDIMSEFSKIIGTHDLEHIERLSMIIYINDSLISDREIQSLKLTDLDTLKDFVREFPDNIDVLWSIGIDDEMQKGEVRLDAIFSGKNLKL